ncbi:unnamed protein product, partial [Symbiodinium sp. CCMP2456]
NQFSIAEGEGTHDESSDSMCIIDDDDAEESPGASKDVASAAAAPAAVDPMEIIDSDTELTPQEDSPAPLSKVPLVAVETQEASSDPPVGKQTFADSQLIQLMCIDSDDDAAQAAPLPKCDTSASSLPVPEDRDKVDDAASYVGGSTDSLEKSMVLDLAPKDVPRAPVPKVSKYPEVCPPQPEFLESMDKCIAEAEPPLYNSTGLAGGKKRRRRGKQAEEPAPKKSKVADHAEDDCGDDDNHDDDGEPHVSEDEAMEESTTHPVKAPTRKPKLLEKQVAEPKKNQSLEAKVADRQKAPVDPKVTDAVCKKAAKKAEKPAAREPAPVDAKAHAPKKAKPVEKKDPEEAEPVNAKMADRKKDESAAAEVGKVDGASADDLPSREELEKMGAFTPPDHIHGNNIYSNAYRQSLKVDNCKENAKAQGRRASAMFKAYGLCLPEMVGTFRASRRKPNKQGTSEP